MSYNRMKDFNTKEDFITNMKEVVCPNHGITADDLHVLSIPGMMINSLGDMYDVFAFQTYDAKKEMFSVTAEKRDSLLKHGRPVGVYEKQARPAQLYVNIKFSMQDFLAKIPDNEEGIKEYIIDKNAKIFIGDKVFTFDYNVKILCYFVKDTTLAQIGNYAFVAEYMLDDLNPISNIKNPNIPVVLSKDGAEDFFTLLLNVYQYERVYKEYKYINEYESNIIKLTYSRQLADFNVYYKDSPYDLSVGRLLNKSMFFDKVQDRKETIFFKYSGLKNISLLNKYRHGNFYPSNNSTFTIELFETIGVEGNFEYTGDDIRFEYTTEYDTLDAVVTIDPKSINGANTQSLEELRYEIIDSNSRRDSVISENDINRYYLGFKADSRRYRIIKHRDDFFARSFNICMALQDEENDMLVPTNTIDVICNSEHFTDIDGHYLLLEEGTRVVMDDQYLYARVEPETLPVSNSEEK